MPTRSNAASAIDLPDNLSDLLRLFATDAGPPSIPWVFRSPVPKEARKGVKAMVGPGEVPKTFGDALSWIFNWIVGAFSHHHPAAASSSAGDSDGESLSGVLGEDVDSEKLQRILNTLPPLFTGSDGQPAPAFIMFAVCGHLTSSDKCYDFAASMLDRVVEAARGGNLPPLLAFVTTALRVVGCGSAVNRASLPPAIASVLGPTDSPPPEPADSSAASEASSSSGAGSPVRASPRIASPARGLPDDSVFDGLVVDSDKPGLLPEGRDGFPQHREFKMPARAAAPIRACKPADLAVLTAIIGYPLASRASLFDVSTWGALAEKAPLLDLATSGRDMTGPEFGGFLSALIKRSATLAAKSETWTPAATLKADVGRMMAGVEIFVGEITEQPAPVGFTSEGDVFGVCLEAAAREAAAQRLRDAFDGAAAFVGLAAQNPRLSAVVLYQSFVDACLSSLARDRESVVDRPLPTTPGCVLEANARISAECASTASATAVAARFARSMGAARKAPAPPATSPRGSGGGQSRRYPFNDGCVALFGEPARDVTRQHTHEIKALTGHGPLHLGNFLASNGPYERMNASEYARLFAIVEPTLAAAGVSRKDGEPARAFAARIRSRIVAVGKGLGGSQ